MSVQMFSVSERRFQQQKALPMERPEEAVDERAADESSLLHRNPDRHMREFLEEIQGHGEPKGCSNAAELMQFVTVDEKKSTFGNCPGFSFQCQSESTFFNPDPF